MVSALSGFLKPQVLRESRIMPFAQTSHVLEVEEVPLEVIDADLPTPKRRPSPLAGNCTDPPIHILSETAKAEPENNGGTDFKVQQDENNDNDMDPEAPNEEDESDDDTPKFREASESEPSSPSLRESEYSEGFGAAPLHGVARRQISPSSREATSSTRCSTNDESLSILVTIPGTGVPAVLPKSPNLSRESPTSRVESNGALPSILAPTGSDVGKFSASSKSQCISQKKRGKRVLHFSDTLGHLSSHSSSPRRPSLALTLPQSPESLIRHSCLSAGGLTPRSLLLASPQKEIVRRSSRESNKPDAYTPSATVSPPRKRARRKHPNTNPSRVYWEETADAGDDWDAFGEMARKDDGKGVVWKPLKEADLTAERGDDSLKKSSTDMHASNILSRVYDVEDAFESYSQQQHQPLSVWCEDAKRHSRILNAKGQRTFDNIEILADWLGTLASQTTLRYDIMEDSGGIVQERADSIIMDNMEDFMQLKVPTFVWSDNDACQQVLEECMTLADRMKHAYDEQIDTWCLNHFSLSKPPASLSSTEIELAWLAEESLYCLQCHSWDWSFIWLHASPELRNLLALEAPLLVRPAVSREFRHWRGLIHKALDGGYRRPHMREIVQRHLYLLYLRKKNEDSH